MKKLDRVMGNSEFFAMFGDCFATFLPYVTSDHSPALLVIPTICSFKKRSFRFMNYLTDKKDFHLVVKNNWAIPVEGYDMYILAKRFKNMKKHLRRINRENGNVFGKVKVLRNELKKV